MQATTPHVDVPGDNADALNGIRPRIMGRSGECVGMTNELAVWRFGFLPDSESADAFGVRIDSPREGFLWVLATRRTGKVRETYRGYAIELPAGFRRVIGKES